MMKNTKKTMLRQKLGFLINPAKAFSAMRKVSFDEQIVLHLKFALLMGFIAGVATVLLNIGTVLFLDLTRSISYNLVNMINYNIGVLAGVFFFYLFAATVITAVGGIILGFFIKGKLVHKMLVVAHSLTPLFVFGWIPILLPGLVIWTVCLIIRGAKSLKEDIDTKSINVRE